MVLVLQDIGKEDLDEVEESAHWRRRYTLRPGLTPGTHDLPSFLEPVKQLVLESGVPMLPLLWINCIRFRTRPNRIQFNIGPTP